MLARSLPGNALTEVGDRGWVVKPTATTKLFDGITLKVCGIRVDPVGGVIIIVIEDAGRRVRTV